MGKMSNYRYEGYDISRDLKDDIPYHTDDIVDLLEEKDQQIVELQKQLEEIKQTGSYQVMLMCQKENILLKQQLKSQPKEIIEKVGEQLFAKARSITGTGVNCVRLYDIKQVLDTILKEYDS